MDIALEGATNSGPRPSIPELQGVYDKLQDLRLKQAKEAAKTNSVSRGCGRCRTRGRGRGDLTDAKGKQPA